MTDVIDLEPTAAPRERISLLAGGISAAFHVVAFVLAAIVWSGMAPRTVVDRPRDVGIRLVSEERTRPDTVGEAAVDADLVETSVFEGAGQTDLASVLPSLDEPPVSLSDLPPLDLPSSGDAQSGRPGFAELPGFADARNERPAFPDTSQADGELIAQEQALIAAGKPQGQVSDVSLFGGTKASGRSFVFAIDRSQSMGAEGIGAIDAAAGELARAVGKLDRSNRFQIVAYNRNLVFLDGERKLLNVDSASGEKTQIFISSLSAFGPTEHGRALLSALALSPEVIYLLTDGGDPGLKDNEISQIARIAGTKTAIHVVCFGREEVSAPGKSLQVLAEACRGSFTFVDLAKKR